jgi:hypothetical protein
MPARQRIGQAAQAGTPESPAPQWGHVACRGSSSDPALMGPAAPGKRLIGLGTLQNLREQLPVELREIACTLRATAPEREGG